MRLLNHTVRPPNIPPKPLYLSMRQDGWERLALALWTLAQGYCVRSEIQRVVAKLANTHYRMGAIFRLIPKLEGMGLAQQLPSTLHLHLARMPLNIVSLTLCGEGLCRELGWEIHENEYQRMKRLHEGDKDESKHTQAVLAFTYLARLRGYAAGVMPEVPEGWTSRPDALVVKGDERLYVEVELSRHVKPQKWRNLADDQGAIALCARNPKHREAMLIDAQSFGGGAPIYATDLASLVRALSRDDYGPLWLDYVPGQN